MGTTSGRLFQMGGIPVDMGTLLPANEFLVVNTAKTVSYNHWKTRWPADSLFTSLTGAYSATVAGRNDVVRLVPDYDADLSATLTWAKNDTHLIGTAVTPLQAHLDINMADTTTFDPMIEVSARGCYFANMTLRHGSQLSSGVGYATDLTCMTVSGRYNYFENVYFYTPLYAEQDVAATYKGVQVTGHGNYFKGCKFGSDGLDRDQKNYNLVVAGVGNAFEDCFFQMKNDGTSPFFVYINNTVRDMKWTLFKNCTFYSHDENFVGAPAYAIDCDAAGGNTAGVLLENCNFVNVSNVSDTTEDALIWKTVTSKDNGADTNVKQMIALRNQGA